MIIVLKEIKPCEIFLAADYKVMFESNFAPNAVAIDCDHPSMNGTLLAFVAIEYQRFRDLLWLLSAFVQKHLLLLWLVPTSPPSP